MMTPTRHRIAACVTLLWWLPLAFADPPPGYYDSVGATSSATLRATLHAVIDDADFVVAGNLNNHCTENLSS